jgi:hypothetical protein
MQMDLMKQNEQIQQKMSEIQEKLKDKEDAH